MNAAFFTRVICLVTAVSLAACSSTTLIRSSDPDSEIYVNDEYRGTEEIYWRDTKIVGTRTRVKIKKEGCQPQEYSFARDESFDGGACIGGIFVLVPFLWIMKYKPMHEYEFECEKL